MLLNIKKYHIFHFIFIYIISCDRACDNLKNLKF